MFKKEDFELPLEKQLRMRVIQQEISDCTDIDVLKEQLVSCASSLMQYQHLLSKAVEANLENFLTDLSDTMGIEISKGSDA
jgi:hypothetical protein